ncbi:MAG: hypothetical protein AB7O52_05810 [Planctomycetota bacterium]
MRISTLLCCLLATCTLGGLASAQPANDDCANAIAVGVGSMVATGNITLATNDGTATCGASGTNRDVWYSFTAPAADTYRVTTCGTHDAPGLNLGMDTVLSALDACGGLQLACNDDNGAACTGLDAGIFRDSSISLTLALGETVIIRVSHFGTVIANGDFVLNILTSTPEICNNGTDDDFDGLSDCADVVDCPTGVAPCIEAGNCADGIDNDADGLVDCNDADCLGDPLCAPPANDECLGATVVVVGANPISTINATNSPEPPPVGPCTVFGVNSNDTWYSFTATNSVAHEFNTCGVPGFDTDMTVYEGPCGALVQVACNGDGTGLAGCQIFYSRLTATLNAGTTYLVRIGGFGAATEGPGTLNIVEAGPEVCTDGIDNDFDGLIDCTDMADCPTGIAPCIEDCADGIDNDGDGLTDCTDVVDCPAGVAPCIEDCADGIDNDGDGLVDCNDTLECPLGMAPCIEVCNDGFDNDTDGLIDCNDGDCAGDVACLAGGNDFCGGALPVICGDIVFGDTTMATAEPWPTCGTTSGTGGGVWYQFAGNGDQVTLTTCAVGTTYDTKIRVWSGSCAAPVCVAGNDDAACAIAGLRSTVAFLTTPGETYFILVHGFAATQGMFEMSVTCLTPGAEDCMNGLDDDLDGLIDCLDADCSAVPACAPPANDDCAGALSVGLGATAFSTTLATDSAVPGPTVPCNGIVGQFNQDIWFEFTPATTASYLIDTCAAGSFDTDMLVYTGGCGALVEEDCSGDGVGLVGCQTFYSALTLTLNAGTSYLIRIGGFGAATAGSGTLNIAIDCGNLGAVTCTYDCTTDQVAINWTDNLAATSGYNIFENGVMVGSAPAGSSSFALANPVTGTNTYTVEWACSLGGMGTTGTCTVTVQPPVVIPGGTTDVILHLEGLQNAGALGLVDSGAALETALVNNGRSVARVAPANFDVLINSGCLDLSGVQTLWVMTGTFAQDYRISAGEGDALAALAASGVGIYFEAGDHWGFQHVVSLLDDRDGIDAAGNLDGNDTYGQMDGANAVIAGLDLSANVDVAYTQDQAGNDFTDQLAITGTDASVTSVEAIWTNSDDTMTGELAYVTGAIAVHADGGVMISTAWEFGGYGGNQDALALEYLNALGRTGPVGDMFKRGDCNNDNGFNIADAVFLLGNLFPPPGGMPNVLACRDACDGNNDGGINIADAVAMLGALFPPPGMPSPGLPAPFGMCGLDTGMDVLDCAGYNHCP